jgi:plastocyanin
MKKILIFLALITTLLIIIGIRFYSPFTRSGETITILMTKENFEPSKVRIKKGTKVVFKNTDEVSRWPASNLHPTHGIYPEFDPQKEVVPNSEWSFIFDKIGVWKYHDHLLPQIRGEIEVTN